MKSLEERRKRAILRGGAFNQLFRRQVEEILSLRAREGRRAFEEIVDGVPFFR